MSTFFLPLNWPTLTVSPDVDLRLKSGALSPTLGSGIGAEDMSRPATRQPRRWHSRVRVGTGGHRARSCAHPRPQRSVPLRLGEEVQELLSRQGRGQAPQGAGPGGGRGGQGRGGGGRDAEGAAPSRQAFDAATLEGTTEPPGVLATEHPAPFRGQLKPCPWRRTRGSWDVAAPRCAPSAWAAWACRSSTVPATTRSRSPPSTRRSTPGSASSTPPTCTDRTP